MKSKRMDIHVTYRLQGEKKTRVTVEDQGAEPREKIEFNWEYFTDNEISTLNKPY
jgi:hypothetical protein